MSFAKNTPIQFIPGIGVRTTKVLHSLDIYTAGQLNRVPTKMLIAMFGPSIRVVLNNLHGATRHCVTPYGALQTHHRHDTKNNKKSLVKRLQLATQFLLMI